MFGGQIGYRWQSGQFVFGLEGQGDWANLSGSHVSVINPLFTTGVKVDALGLVTGQIGYASNASLFYLKGGAATTRNRLDVWSTATGVNAATASSNRWGGAAGVGWEYGFSPNWSAGIEYDHLFMGDANNSFSVANPPGCRCGQPHQPGRGYGHPALQLQTRWLWGWRPLLINPLSPTPEAPAFPGLLLIEWPLNALDLRRPEAYARNVANVKSVCNDPGPYCQMAGLQHATGPIMSLEF